MGRYQFNSLYPPERPVQKEASGKQKLQITNISRDRTVLLVRHLTKKNRKGTFTPLAESIRSIRASSLGGRCKADVWLSVHGYPGVVSDSTQNIFDVGTAMEPFILAWLQDQLGWEVKANSSDEEGIIIAVRGGVITGHIDALVRTPLLMPEGVWGLCDAKTMNDKNFTDWTEKGTVVSKPGYDMQLSVYAHAYSQFLPVDYKVLVAMNKNNSAFSAEVMNREPNRWEEEIKVRAEAILLSPEFEPPEEIDSSDCFFCFRKKVCSEIREDAVSGLARVSKLTEKGNLLQVLANAYELYDRDMNPITPEVPAEVAPARDEGTTLHDLGGMYDDDYAALSPGDESCPDYEPETESAFNLNLPF